MFHVEHFANFRLNNAVLSYCTATVPEVVRVTAPLTPLIVNDLVVAVAVEAAVSVRIEVPDPVMEAGLKAPVTPVGSPVTLRLIVPVKEPFGAIVAVYVVVPPIARL